MLNEDPAGGEGRDAEPLSGVGAVSAPRGEPYTGLVVDQRYVVEALMAEGGMGRVYRCRHRILDRKLAIKIIRSDVAQHPDAAQRFLIEAKAASAIGNEHIVDIIDFGALPDGAAYLVMEFLDGAPLSSLVDPGSPLAAERVVSITLQIAEGLSAAHSAGIVHRDLKPDNIILLERKGEDFVKVLDFGVAQMAFEPGSKVTRAGTIVGTPCYMSPEQCSGAALDHRSDIYSLGVMMYELAAGRLPFEGEHYLAVLHQHVNDPPRPFAALTPPVDVPRELERIIFKCLAKQPEQRYATLAELMCDVVPLAERQSAAMLGPAGPASAAVAEPASVAVESGSLPVVAQAASQDAAARPASTARLASPAPPGNELSEITPVFAVSPVATAVLPVTDSPATERALPLQEGAKAPQRAQRLYLALLVLGAFIGAWGLRGLSSAEPSASATPHAAPRSMPERNVNEPLSSAALSTSPELATPTVRPIPSSEPTPAPAPEAPPESSTAPSVAEARAVSSKARTASNEANTTPSEVGTASGKARTPSRAALRTAPLATEPPPPRASKPSSTRPSAAAVRARREGFINPWPER